MTTFNDRENAFENKFAHDAELQFKLVARRDRLVGLWAAGKLGLEGDAADAYAKSIVTTQLAHAGDGDVIAKLVADLAGAGVSDADVRAALADQAAVARRQLIETL